MDITKKNGFDRTNAIIAGFVFLLTFVVYALTVQRSFSFWDCGEFIACSYILGIPHPPGTPLFVLIGHLFALIPFVEDVSYRIKGFWQTIFRYGNVLIQTSTPGSDLEVRKIRHPQVLQDLINELRLEVAKQETASGDEKLGVLKEFTDKLSIAEIKILVKKLKEEEKDQALHDLYSEDEG